MIELPKNLKPKTRLLIFTLRNIVCACIFGVISAMVVSKLGLSFQIKLIVGLVIFTVMIIIILFDCDGRDFIVLLRDNLIHIIEPNYLIYDKKIVKDSTGKRVRALKLESEKLDKMFKLLGYNQVCEDGIFQGRDGYYYKYLEIKINKNPRFETETQKKNSLDDFNSLLQEVAKNNNGKIFTRNTPISDYQYENQIASYKDFPAYYNLKKYQIERSKRYFNLQYLIEIRARDIELLTITENTLINTFSGNLNVNSVSSELANEIHQERLNNYDVEIKANHIYNKQTKEYECYMSLNELNSLQKYYYLQDLFASQYDLVMMYRKPKDISDTKTLNGAYAELLSSEKFDHSITGKIKNGVQRRQLLKITTDLEIANGELYSMDIIVKVVAKDIETLEQRKRQMHVYFKGKLKLLNNTYIQKKMLVRYNRLGVEIADRYIIPNEYLSYSYPFNFVKFTQHGGLLKNVDRENLLILDYQRKGTNQLSFGYIVLGDKGSGKSTFLKEKAIDDIFHYNGNVIMIDFNSETETMVRNFAGKYVDIAGMPINILRVNINPESINNVEEHVVFVSKCISILYEDLDVRYFRKMLMELYKNNKIDNDTIFEQKHYPTISDLIDLLEGKYDKRASELKEMLLDMKFLYPYLTDIDTGFEFDNKLISISFHAVKRDVKLTNALMYYFVTLISTRTSLNYFSAKYYEGDDSKLSKYLKYYMNVIGDNQNFEYVNNLSRTELQSYFYKHKKMFSIIIDEAHHVFKYPMLSQELITLAREDRKNFTSLTFADQSTHSLEDNADFLLIYSLMQYKVFFTLEETNKAFLSKLNFLQQEIKDITSGRFGAGEGILKINDKTFKINSRITKEMDYLFEGRN